MRAVSTWAASVLHARVVRSGGGAACSAHRHRSARGKHHTLYARAAARAPSPSTRPAPCSRSQATAEHSRRPPVGNRGGATRAMRARGAPDARARGAPPCPAPFSCATPLFPCAAPPARVHAACVLAARRAIEHDARAGRPRRARARRPLCPHPSSLALTWCVSAHARHALIRLRGAPCTSARCVRARSAPSITSSRARRAPEARAFGAPPVPPPLLLAFAHLVRYCAPAPRPDSRARRPLRECARRTCNAPTSRARRAPRPCPLPSSLALTTCDLACACVPRPYPSCAAPPPRVCLAHA